MISPKKIGANSITGQQCVNLIERFVLEMGFLWYPTGAIEGGIDGTIEIRYAESDVITNSIIQVQSKATKSDWTGELDNWRRSLSQFRPRSFAVNRTVRFFGFL